MARPPETRPPMDRRAFTALGACAIAAGRRSGGAVWAGSPAVAFTRYRRVLLTTPEGQPLRAGRLDLEEEYLFFYPFAGTPCVLLDLGRPLTATEVPVRGGAGYAWGGGVGPSRSVVAFTAVCPHEWSHPEPAFSAIGYHRGGQPAAVTGGRSRLIVCCAHGSAFDPTAGGRVEQGPAEVPLAAVVLSWDPGQDRFFAHGLLGRDSFERFFSVFKGKSRAVVDDETPVMRLRDYSATVARC